MKVIYTEEVEQKTAFNRKKYCAKCGSHMYEIHHQLDPQTSSCWWVACEQCGHEGFAAPIRTIAIARWKQE